MPTLNCRRCGLEKESLDKPPFRGAFGQRIYESACRDCWNEWMAMQTKIINEYRVNLGDPAGQQMLDHQLKTFLNLPDQP